MSFPLQEQVSLRSFNSFGVDARARWYANVRCLEDLQQLRGDGRLRGLPRLVLGGGSNVLFVDDYPGLVAHIDIGGCEELGVVDDAHLIRVERACPGRRWSSGWCATGDRAWRTWR